jgi:hypothetical protein
MPCECRTCKQHQRIQAVADGGDVAAMREIIRELEDTLASVELDYQVDQAILHGTWPGAREMLMAALDKCPADDHDAAHAEPGPRHSDEEDGQA